MTGSSYGRSKARATKKRKRVPKAEAKKPKKGVKRSTVVVTTSRKKPVKKALTRKRATKRRSTRTTERKSGAKRLKVGKKAVNTRSRAKSPKKVGKGGTSSSVRKPKPKTRAKKAVARPKRPKPLTPAQKGARTKARRKAEREAVARQLAKLNRDRAKLRNKGQKGKRSLRQKLNARLKGIAKRQTERKLVTEKLPRKTPREKKKSREELFEHFRNRFYELHDIAEKKRQLPDVDYRERRIRSDKNNGDIRILRIESEVTEGTIESIMYQVKNAAAKMSGRYPIWMGVLVFTGMGERLIGYGNRVLDAADPDAAQFQTQGIESTGILPTAKGMLLSIEETLNDYAAEEYTVVYCEHIKLMNFARINGR